MGPRAGLSPNGIRSPDRLSRSQSPYRLRYPAHSYISTMDLISSAFYRYHWKTPQRNGQRFSSRTRCTNLHAYHMVTEILSVLLLGTGPGSSVGIATELRAGRSEDRIPVGRDFPPVQTGPGAHTASCTMCTGSFPGVKYGRGMLLTTHQLLVPRSWNNKAISLPSSGPQPGLLREQLTYVYYILSFAFFRYCCIIF